MSAAERGVSNEAAERLRHLYPALQEGLLDEALAAERRATVERIRSGLLLGEGVDIPEEYAERVLDEVAAR